MRGLGIAAAIMMVGVAAAGTLDGWHRYTNPRFGASAEIPPGFVANEEPANGDGLRFSDYADDAAVSVYGSLNVEDESLPARLSTLVGFAEADGWTVSYQKGGAGWIAFSGMRQGRIFYEKVILACDRGVFNAVRLEYPAEDKTAFDPIVTRVTKSLSHDNRGGCG